MKQDYSLAEKWYALGAKNGDANAKNNVINIRKKIKESQPAPKKSGEPATQQAQKKSAADFVPLKRKEEPAPQPAPKKSADDFVPLKRKEESAPQKVQEIEYYYDEKTKQIRVKR